MARAGVRWSVQGSITPTAYCIVIYRRVYLTFGGATESDILQGSFLGSWPRLRFPDSSASGADTSGFPVRRPRPAFVPNAKAPTGIESGASRPATRWLGAARLPPRIAPVSRLGAVFSPFLFSDRVQSARRYVRCATATSRGLRQRSYFAPIFSPPHHSMGRNPSRRRALARVSFVQI